MIERERSRLKKAITIIGMIILYLLLVTNVGNAARYPLKDYGTEMTDAEFNNVRVPLNLSDRKVSDSIDNLGIMNNGNNFVNTALNVEYAVRYKKAITIGSNKYDLRICVIPKEINNACQLSFATDNTLWVKPINSKVEITYEITEPDGYGGITGQYFGYGLMDPDGGDYLFNPASYEIYYVDAPRNDGVGPLDEYYSVYTDTDYMGISRFNVFNTDYVQGKIIIGRYGTARFTFVVDTTKDPIGATPGTGTEDYVNLPIITYSPKKLYFRYDVNGGYLAPEHGTANGISGSLMTVNGNTNFHSIYIGAALGTNGLADYNNEGYINIKRFGYHAEVGKEYNSKADGTGITYSQSTQYKSKDFVTNNGNDLYVTMFVRWIKTAFNISYVLNGGTNASGNPTSYYYDSSLISISNPSRTGYTFAGWKKTISNLDWKAGYLNYSTGVAETSSTYPNSYYTGLISLKEGVTYTISGNGDYAASGIRWRIYNTDGTYRDGANSGLTYTPTSDCYARILFYNSSTKDVKNNVIITANKGDTSVKIPSGSAGKITLAAQWTINSSTLNVNPNGGTVNVTNGQGTSADISSTTSYTQNYNTKLTLNTPTKAGTSSAVTYTVSYNGNNGTVGTLTDGNRYSTKTTNTSYSFNEWTKSNPFYGTLSTDNKTYTFPSNNGVTSTLTAAYTLSTAIDTTSITLPSATRTGYTLEGWYTQATGGTKIGDVGETYTPTGNITLYAQWSQIPKSKLIIDPDSEDVYYVVSGVVSQKPDPSVGGGDYVGVATITREAGKKITIFNPTKPYTISSEEYTISYNGNGGEVEELISENIQSLKRRRTRYTFSHWEEDNPFYGTLTPVNLGLVAVRYTYEFPSNNNVVSKITAIYTESQQNLGQTDIVLPDASNPGYKLTGWYTEPTGGTKRGDPGDTYKPTQSETLYAQWEPIIVTITIKKDDSDWTTNNDVVVELRSETQTYDNGVKNGATITWSAIPEGTYDIYASKNNGNYLALEDSGVDLVVSNAGTATIDYYTLQLQPGIGISAVSGAGTYLKNQQANIDVTVTTGYTWQGWSVISGNNPN